MYSYSRGSSLFFYGGIFPHVSGGLFDNTHGRYTSAREEHFPASHSFGVRSVFYN